MNSPTSKKIITSSNTISSESPSRVSSHVKRKIDETFYRPSVTKTHLISAEQVSRIHHSHTNSLPIDTISFSNASNHLNKLPIKNASTLASASSANNLYDSSQMQTANIPILNQVHSNPMMAPTTIQNVYMNQTQQLEPPGISQHTKTYSLPVPFDPSNSFNNTYMINNLNNNLQPPPMPTTYNMPYGDVPLPAGWEAEIAPNGQVYYSNSITKQTTWEDPRKQYNLPTNQSDISQDLKAHIIKTIPLPTGWQEATTGNGEVYYINHNNKTTQWQDPRIAIYVQQEQGKYQNNQLKSASFNNFQNYNNYTTLQDKIQSVSPLTTSSSSLYSSSVISTSSSNSSLNNLSLSMSNNSFQSFNTSNNDNIILNLKKSLDELTEQKNSICNQLKELSKQEMELKSKLTSKDLDDILRQLKTNNVKMNSFSQYDKSTTIQPSHVLNEAADMDSTLIA